MSLFRRVFCNSLEDPFTKEEISQALKEADGDKAPSPDGFSFTLVKSFYHIFEANMISLFHRFHSSEEFDRKFSESFLSLF